jgi:hypothetical protein
MMLMMMKMMVMINFSAVGEEGATLLSSLEP